MILITGTLSNKPYLRQTHAVSRFHNISRASFDGLSSSSFCRASFRTTLPSRGRHLPSSRGAILTVTATAAPATPPSLEQALKSVIAARRDFEAGNTSITEESLAEMLASIESAAADAGLNRVFSSDNDGSFDGIPLTGRTATRLSMPLPLGMLSFNAYAPTDLVVEVLGSDDLAASGLSDIVTAVFKGKGYGQDHSYVLSTAFKIPGTQIIGVSRAIGEYTIASPPATDGQPISQRLDIKFHTMRLEPLLAGGDSSAEIKAWNDVFLAANATMDAASGVLEVPLVGAPPGWQDYLLMGHTYQLARGNAGSITLLKRK